MQTSGRGVEGQAELPGLEDFAVGSLETGEEQPAPQLRVRRVPVDVEEIRVGGIAAVLEDVPPPGVLAAADPDVVRHEVEDLPHSVRAQRLHQAIQVGFLAQLGVQGVVVGDVVAVSASLAGSQVRRAVHVAHSEIGEVGDEPLGVAKREAWMKL